MRNTFFSTLCLFILTSTVLFAQNMEKPSTIEQRLSAMEDRMAIEVVLIPFLI